MHVKRRNVLPRLCNTDRTHVPIAADSFAFDFTLIVLRTCLIHRQNLRDTEFRLCISYQHTFFIGIVEDMASWNINRMTHARDDQCGIQSYYSQSVGPGRYITTNLVPRASGVNPAASDQLLIYPREGYGYNNAAIDADSAIRNQPGFKNNRCQTRAQNRPFLSVPYMAGGRGNPDVESLLIHSEQVRMGKECGTVTEQFFDQQYVPMIPLLKANVQKPSNLIEESAAPGWIHGGIPTRSYLRDVNC